MAAYNKYRGNSGFVGRVEDGPAKAARPEREKPRPGISRHAENRTETRPPSPLSGLSGEMGRLFGKLGSLSLETEDLLLILILYLLYRESGDSEFLIMIGAFLFL